MAEVQGIFRNMKLSAILEDVEGTPKAETAASAVLLGADGAEFDLTKDMNDNPFMTGSLSQVAAKPSMWSDSMGVSTNTLLRGKGTLTQPDNSVFLTSLFGTQTSTADGVIDALSTTDVIQIKSGAAALVLGQLVYFPEQQFISRVVALAAGQFSIWPPLPDTPDEDDVIDSGFNWMLSSSAHPAFTCYGYFDGGKRIRLSGCKTNNGEFTFEVGAYAKCAFTSPALDALLDYTAQTVTPEYDTTTEPLTCLGIDMSTRYAGIAKGVPTTTQTILTAPSYDVAVGDSISIDVGAGVWETVAVTVVSGNAGADTTLTHAAVTVAASAEDVVYITRSACAQVGDTLTITIDTPSEFKRCMVPSSGKTAQYKTERMVTIAATPYFQSWQEFYLRDNVVSSGFMVTLGSRDSVGDLVSDSIMCFYVPNKINTEVSLTTDMLMKIDVTSQASVDAVLGNDHEIVCASF